MKPELFFATTNKGKIASLQRLLPEVIVKQVPIDIPEPRSSDVEEIAKAKVLYAYKELKKPVVALDAGFYVDSLNGFPRAYVNFMLETIGLWGLLRLVENKSRKCEFRHCVAYMAEGLLTPKTFIDHRRGVLAVEPRGEAKDFHWSKLVQVFIFEGEQQTLAELSFEEYQGLNREADGDSANQQFARWYRKFIENKDKE